MTSTRQRGVGLIEVAISLLVLSIGVLGFGRLQIDAKRLGYEAIQRTEAAALAMDLLERMRANRAALPAYAVTAVGAASGSEQPAPTADCNAGSCSPADLNTWDLWQWERAINGAASGNGAGGLVGPTACVQVSGRRVTVDIAWQGYRALSAPAQAIACGAGNYGPDDADRQWLRVNSWIGAE